MHISYLTSYNPHDIHNWSGTPYFIAKAMEAQNNEMDYIYKFSIKHGIPNKLKWLYWRLQNTSFQMYRTEYVVKQYAKQIPNMIKSNTDALLSPSSLFYSYLDVKQPKAFYTDACYAGILGFYPSYSKVAPETIKNGHMLEKKALDNCDLAIYSSSWAAKTAIEHYNIDPGKVKVVPYGANIEYERDASVIKSNIIKRKTDECHLLFIGVDWERKRGNFALNVAKILNKNGLKTKLHIVGISDMPEKNLPDFAINHGFVSKSSHDGKQLLDRLFLESHFMIVPTLAEAYGLVFCEANSYGLPSIATDVGGVSTIIKNDVNGFAFNVDDDEQEYAKYIERLFSNPAEYQRLSLSSFNEYEHRLNWRTAGATITKLLSEL